MPVNENPIIPELSADATKQHHAGLNIANTVLNFLLIFLIVLGIRTYVIAPFQVSGASMTNTLEDQEYIIVNKFLYENFFGLHFGDPQRGDIVVLEPPINRKTYYIKRVIGLPGETVKLNSNSVIIINAEHPEGLTLTEDYLRCTEKVDSKLINHCDYSTFAKKEFTVPEGQYFVMGDNRMNSTDSRVCFASCSLPDATPFVSKEHIIGKTWFVVWPLNHWRVLGSVTY